MNIRVDLNTAIYDGMEVVFKAPCDYAEVVGLTLYYPAGAGTASHNFAFADAHANDLAHLDVLFAKDAVVKVILDLSTNKAFVQNADTNAYLEGRFASLPIAIVDKLCPTFTASGSVVTCEPVEGYPLEVVSLVNPNLITEDITGESGYGPWGYDEEFGSPAYCAGEFPAGTYTIYCEVVDLVANTPVSISVNFNGGFARVDSKKPMTFAHGGGSITLVDDCFPTVIRCVKLEVGTKYTGTGSASNITRCGKNLYFNPLDCDTINSPNSGLTIKQVKGESSTRIHGECTVDASVRLATAIPIKAGTYWISLHGANKIDDGHDRLYVPLAGGGGVNYIRAGVPKELDVANDTTLDVNFIVKAGSIYNNATISVQIEAGNTATAYEPYTSDTFAPGETVPALKGVNTLYADVGEVAVTGRSNPVAIINDLHTRLAALEAAAVNNAQEEV